MPERTHPREYRELVTLVVAGLGIVAFAQLTGADLIHTLPDRIPLIGSLEGDLSAYAWRFALSFLLLGLAPLGVALACGERPGDLGLRAPKAAFPWWIWAGGALACVVSAWISAYDREISAYYPYSRTLLERIRLDGPGVFALHAVIYTLFYYLPWELVFRGILVYPVLRAAPGGRPARLLFLASLQAVPSAMLHFGHPLLESLSAVPFGVVVGWLALKTGSILPGLALHAGVGVLLDLLLALRYIGVLP